MFFQNAISVIFLVFLVELKLASGESADKYFNICSRSSKDFEICIQNTIMAARPYLAKGIPEIELPTLDPYSLAPIPFKESNRHFKMSAVFSDFKMTGISDMIVNNVRVNGDLDSGMTINLTITGPLFRYQAKWKGAGRALQFHVNGNGSLDVNITQTDFKVSIKGQAEVSEKDGKKYFAVQSTAVDPIIRKVHVYVSDLFPQDKNLNKAANKFFNRNILFILKILNKYPREVMSLEFGKIVKIVFSGWPIDELMLP